MPKSPPYKSALPYFKRDTEAYCAVHRVAWTNADRTHTIDTIWYGDQTVHDYYVARIGRRRLFGLPTLNPIPAHPYQVPDVVTAKTSHTLPPERDAAGNPIPAVVWVNAAAIPAAPTPLPPPPSRPINSYPFSFWPAEPWDPEPEDVTLGLDAQRIAENPDAAAVWIENDPDMWPLADESLWRGGKFLGAGGFGCAGLWCKEDAAGNIQRHLVIKEARPKNSDWRDPEFWRDHKPKEIRTHQLIDANRPESADPGFSNLIRHHGYRLMMDQKRFKVYLDFCRGGDLWAALRTHFATWDNGFDLVKIERRNARLELPDDNGEAAPDLDTYNVIPEGLIWHIFGSVVDACIALQTGKTPSAAAEANWKPITHLDIGSRNLFLKPSSDGDVPNVILADFGMSFYDLEHDIATAHRANPQEYTIDMRNFKYPPEVQRIRRAPDGTFTQIGEKSDVWAIGSLIWKLLSNIHHEEPRRDLFNEKTGTLKHVYLGQRDYGRMGEPGSNPPFETYYPAFNRYSKTIMNLMARCLNWNPDHRPTLMELRHDIRAYLDTNPEVRDDTFFENFNMAHLEEDLRINSTPSSKKRRVEAEDEAQAEV